MPTITKKQLVDVIAQKTGQTKLMCRENFQLFLDIVIQELRNGNRIELRDFGIFEVKERAARIGRNPRTGETVQIPPRNVVRFKVGRKMEQKVAGN